jgi:tricorn protease
LDVHTASLSKDGTKLAYSVFSHVSNIWSIRIPEDGSISNSEAQPTTIGNQNIEGCDISLDAQWLAFDSYQSGNSDIYKMPTAGGEPIQLTIHPSDHFSPSWSPNQKRLHSTPFAAATATSS